MINGMRMLNSNLLLSVGDDNAENVCDVLEVGHHVVHVDAGGCAKTCDHGVEPAN